MTQLLSLLDTPLKVLGAAILLKNTYSFLKFIHFHFLRSASYGRYLHGPGPTPYVIITGATDGIGKAISRQLFEKGFNLILHGRNETKMKLVIAEIQTARSGGDIKYFIADATREHDFAAILKEYEALEVTLVVNNVGGMLPQDFTIDKWDEAEVEKVIRMNALFPTFFSRALLPSLRKTAERRPVQVIFVGSIAGELGIPRIAQYSASKSFVKHLVMGLDEDEKFRPTIPNGNLSFMYLLVGSVRSGSMVADSPLPGWMYPPAESFANTLIASIGCGKLVVTPHLGHAVGLAITSWMPESTGKKMTRENIKDVLVMGDKDKKS